MTDIKLEDEKLDPRIRRTRNYIQEAFQSLLEEKSFKSITVREITDRAEVNRATFYAHHKDKYELLNETLRRIFREELEHRALNVCHYSQANLRALVMTVCEFIRDSSSNCKTVDSQFELIVENQVRQQIQELLELWLEKMVAVEDRKSIAVATSWTIYGLAEQWGRAERRENLETYTDKVLPLVRANLPG